jgi:hypothetical protein
MSQESLRDQLKQALTTGRLHTQPAEQTKRAEDKTAAARRDPATTNTRAVSARRDEVPVSTVIVEVRGTDSPRSKAYKERDTSLATNATVKYDAEGLTIVQRREKMAVEAAAEALATTVRTKKWTTRAVAMARTSISKADQINKAVSLDDPRFAGTVKDMLTTAMKVQDKIQVEQKKFRVREMTTARRSAENLINYLRTVIEAAAVRDITLEHMPEIYRKVRAKFRDLRDQVKSVAEANDNQGADRELAQLTEQNVQRYAPYRRQLEQAVAAAYGKAMFTIDMPIIPMLGGGVTTDDLINSRLPAEPISMYSALVRQRVIALNPEVLAKKGYNREEYVAKTLVLMNKRSSQNYELVMDKPVAYAKTGFGYYWCMPRKQLAAMQRAGQKDVTVDGWGFAF